MYCYALFCLDFCGIFEILCTDYMPAVLSCIKICGLHANILIYIHNLTDVWVYVYMYLCCMTVYIYTHSCLILLHSNHKSFNCLPWTSLPSFPTTKETPLTTLTFLKPWNPLNSNSPPPQNSTNTPNQSQSEPTTEGLNTIPPLMPSLSTKAPSSKSLSDLSKEPQTTKTTLISSKSDPLHQD